MPDEWTWNRLLKSILIFKFIFTFDQNIFTSPAIDLTSFCSPLWVEEKHCWLLIALFQSLLPRGTSLALHERQDSSWIDFFTNSTVTWFDLSDLSAISIATLVDRPYTCLVDRSQHWSSIETESCDGTSSLPFDVEPIWLLIYSFHFSRVCLVVFVHWIYRCVFSNDFYSLAGPTFSTCVGRQVNSLDARPMLSAALLHISSGSWFPMPFWLICLFCCRIWRRCRSSHKSRFSQWIECVMESTSVIGWKRTLNCAISIMSATKKGSSISGSSRTNFLSVLPIICQISIHFDVHLCAIERRGISAFSKKTYSFHRSMSARDIVL